MGLSKGSRKGKKAWRRNISTAQVEEAVARRSADERKGLDFSGVEDTQLFFVDKNLDEGGGKAGRVSKRQRRAPKLLKCQAILQGAHQARPVEGITKRNKKGGPGKKAHMLGQAAQPIQLARPQPNTTKDEFILDPWDEPNSGSDGGWGTSIKVTGSKQPTLRGRASKTSRERSLPSVAAVEVDAPGCSYNPDAEQHQDVVAEAVAVEMYKTLRSEMAPKAPPAYAPDGVGPEDELYALQVDEEVDLDSEGGSEGEEKDGGRRAEKKSRSKRNREAAVRAAEKSAEERRRLKKQRHELSQLKQLTAEIESETAEQQRLWLRREANELERARSRTPRLGKSPFVNGAIQVLASDEVEHNLRRLKSHPMVLKDRFLSMQQRGTIETRRMAQLQNGKKKKKREVEYDNRASAARAEAAHEEILAMTRSRKKEAKKLKRSVAPHLP